MKALAWVRPLVAGGLLVTSSAEGYQFWTHAEITRLAFEKSEGLQAYLQSTGIQPADRFVRFTRTHPVLLASFSNDGIPRDWMIEGVIREDDYSVHAVLETLFGCPPPENPASAIDRVLNHFLDEQRGERGLTLVVRTLGAPAVDWALGKQGRGPEGNRYSLLDARDYQFQSLTARSRSERELNTALFFRALGHVIHMVQDVAQPQHTRNDAHSGCVEPVGGHASWYENYIETRALGQNYRARGEVSPSLRLDGYSPPKLDSYEAYWTGVQGLARFSSRNFFSAGTNLSLMLGDCGGLPEPPCRLDAYVQRDEAIPVRTIGGRTLRGSVRLFHRSMVDPYTAQVLNAAVTTRSMWDEHLERQGLRPVFTLNTLNYDSAADLLIPRAVGYSAGVLDRFFRASVGAGVNQDQRVSFQNGSPDEIAEGFFFLLHENPDGVREPLATVALALPPLGETEFMEVRKLPPDPPPGTRCWVVFQGTLGEEPNVVAGRQTSCPVEPPPPVQGSQWAIYQCRFIGLIIGVPGGAPPVYYTYATQSPFTYPEGDPVVQFHEEGGNGFTDCWLSGHAFVPEGGWPPEVRLEHPI